MDEIFDGLDPGAGEVNPWRRPVYLVIWGILLTTVTFRFFHLDIILPEAGFVLMYLGLRSLRRENGGFRTAWALSAARLAVHGAGDMWAVVPMDIPAVTYGFFAAGVVLQLAQLLAIRSGLGEVFDAAGVERRLGAVNWLIFLQGAMALLALMDVGGPGVWGAVFIVIYLGMAGALLRIPGDIGDTGYALRNAPVMLGGAGTAAVWLVTLAALVAGARLAGIALCVPEAAPFAPNAGELAGGIPAELAQILSPEDAAVLEDAGEIGCEWYEDGALPGGTVMDLCTVTVRLPEQRLAILHFFRYKEGGPRWGDGFACWQDAILTRDGLPGGAIVYRLGGETYRSEIPRLRAGDMVIRGAVWESSGDRVCGDVYAPVGAENVRGYVMYMTSYRGDVSFNYNCGIDYIHTGPVDTFGRAPSDLLLSGGSDDRSRLDFMTLFTAQDPPAPSAGEYGFIVR